MTSQPKRGQEGGGKDHFRQTGRGETPPTHRDPGCVDETPVEMVQGLLGLFLGLEPDEAKLAELAVFGELQAAVRQRAKGSKQLLETLFLHLVQKGCREGGPGRPQSQEGTEWAEDWRLWLPQEVCSTMRPGSALA